MELDRSYSFNFASGDKCFLCSITSSLDRVRICLFIVLCRLLGSSSRFLLSMEKFCPILNSRLGDAY
jgi:hypothetical protein